MTLGCSSRGVTLEQCVGVYSIYTPGAVLPASASQRVVGVPALYSSGGMDMLALGCSYCALPIMLSFSMGFEHYVYY